MSKVTNRHQKGTF